MSGGAQPAARFQDPVAHSHAMGGFVAGALIGLAAAAGVAVVVGMVATAAAVEIATAGLATPLVAGVVVTVGEFAVNAVVGGALMGMAEDAGEALGSSSMGAPSGAISQGSPDVLINRLPAARVTDAESCDAGKVAQGSASVFVNRRPAGRVGDKVTCGAVIVGGSRNVFIGGGTTSPLPIQSEVPEWVRWAAVVVGILPALGGAARAIGPALAQVEATGLVRAAQTGAKALGRQMEARAGGARPPAAVGAAGDEARTAAAAKLSSASTKAEIEDAREGLKKLSYEDRKAVLDEFADQMDVSTKPGTATFWSGGRLLPTGPGGAMEWNSARSWAEAKAVTGRTTIEQTSGGRVLDKIDIFRGSDPLLKPADASRVWDTASARFTGGASGDIHAYLDSPRAESIYITTERPRIVEAVNSGTASLKEFDLARFHDWMNK
ncbi:PAAR domain-containing protein [Sphingomonas montana]|uniref:PAAR domain-containing protein n=1 Tax=Sphingomonas montana TaxID=1843236 RepID=UPI00096DA9E1|nr:PAAR domain-containing protein [Sphingomonas montana]